MPLIKREWLKKILKLQNGKNKNGKSFSVEWRADNGAEVNIDLGHFLHGDAPTVPHVGWQTGGKRANGGAVRGHIFVDDVPYNR